MRRERGLGPVAFFRHRVSLSRIFPLSCRFVIEGPKSQMFKLSVKDRGKLTCGAQDGRHVSVEFTPKPDEKLGTAGELAAIPES